MRSDGIQRHSKSFDELRWHTKFQPSSAMSQRAPIRRAPIRRPRKSVSQGSDESSNRSTLAHCLFRLKLRVSSNIIECLRMPSNRNYKTCQNILKWAYCRFFKFGNFKFRGDRVWKCPACEILNFEILYLARASFENAPTANMPPWQK